MVEPHTERDVIANRSFRKVITYNDDLERNINNW